MSGLFITIYGINNIGKSTQIKLLVHHLQQEGIPTISIKYPVYELDPTGPALNNILRSHSPQKLSEEELQKLFMQNRKDFEPQLKKLREQYQVVIAEDYTGTGIAWGVAKGLSQEYLEELNKNLIKEDHAFLLKGTRTLAAKETKHIHETDDSLVLKVGNILEELALQKKWEVVEVQPKPEETSRLLWEKISLLIK